MNKTQKSWLMSLGIAIGILVGTLAYPFYMQKSRGKSDYKVMYMWLDRQCRRCAIPVDGGAMDIIQLDKRFNVRDTVRYNGQNVVIIQKY